MTTPIFQFTTWSTARPARPGLYIVSAERNDSMRAYFDGRRWSALVEDDASREEHQRARATPFAAYTAPFNVTGQPAISLPLYWEAARDLPIGVQLAAAQNREDLLLRVASQVEAARPWADRRPPVSA